MARWKIWYSDGTTFDSDQGSPVDAPAKGVALVQTEDGRCGRRNLKMQDWYRWCPRSDRWFDGDAYTLLREHQRHGTVTALPGEYMRDDDFEKILIAAHEDDFVSRVSPDTPPHEAWRA